MLSWLPVAPEATKVIGVPLTVMVSPAAKPAASELVPAAPDNAVVPLIGAGVPAWLLTALPATCSGGSVAVTLPLAPRPSAANAVVLVLVTVRFDPALLRSAIAPPLTVDGIEVPLIESIFESSVCTLSVMLSWLPVAPEATKVIGVPLTEMLSPTAKLPASEVRAGGARQQRRAGDRRRRRCLVVGGQFRRSRAAAGSRWRRSRARRTRPSWCC